MSAVVSAKLSNIFELKSKHVEAACTLGLPDAERPGNVRRSEVGEVESARIPEFELKELSNMFNHVLRMLRAIRFQGEPIEEYRDELILKIADFFNEAVEIVESWGTRAYGNYGSTRVR